jgi:hypothetical protein
MAASVARITLLGRPGCHLCDDARAVIERVAADLGVGWEERDITASPDDLREYWDKIPVTLVDGVQIDFWRVSEARLRAALGRAVQLVTWAGGCADTESDLDHFVTVRTKEPDRAAARDYRSQKCCENARAPGTTARLASRSSYVFMRRCMPLPWARKLVMSAVRCQSHGRASAVTDSDGKGRPGGRHFVNRCTKAYRGNDVG